MQLQGRENGTYIESKISFKNFLSVNIAEAVEVKCYRLEKTH